jgi:hypothetical protein
MGRRGRRVINADTGALPRELALNPDARTESHEDRWRSASAYRSESISSSATRDSPAFLSHHADQDR